VEARPPLVVCLGSERDGLPPGLPQSARIPLRPDGPESLNVAMAATVALYDLANRMAGNA
jgi:tRNA G18 (ribose-2'-O)-methylase SpoU